MAKSRPLVVGLMMVLLLLGGCSGMYPGDSEESTDYTVEYSSYTCMTAPPPEDPANTSSCVEDTSNTMTPGSETQSPKWPNESGLEPECRHVKLDENGTLSEATEVPCPGDE